MPVTRSCAELAARPLALLEALLRRDSRVALRLLEAGGGGGAASQLALTGPALRFTALHAAALAGCAEAIPALVAAGMPVDEEMDVPASACAGQHRCAQRLLEAGADPAAGRGGWTAKCALQEACLQDAERGAWMLPPFLQHGLDPLAPMAPHGDCLLVSSCLAAAELLLDHLEQQRAAGSLQLGSWQRAQQLLFSTAVYGASDGRHAALVAHGIAACEQLLGVANGAGSHGAEPAIAAGKVQNVLERAAMAGQPAALQSLLASQLPLDVRAADVIGRSLLQLTMQNARVCDDDAAGCVRLLLQAGAPVTARDLYTAVDRQLPAALAALLSCGAPAVDVSEPLAPGGNWSCPIHHSLHEAIASHRYVPVKATAALLEVLTAAGFRPTVYRQACLPNFLDPSSDAGVFAELDPLALLDTAHPQHAQVASAVRHWAYSPDFRLPPATLERLLHLARGGGWSPAAHQLWPGSFKAAARTLLLCASISGSGSGDSSGSDRRVTRAAARRHPQRSPNAAARLLGGLPPGVLLQVVRLAAEPMSAWL